MTSTAGAQGAPHPYIPATDADTRIMLDRLGLASTAQLFDALPAELQKEIGRAHV